MGRDLFKTLSISIDGLPLPNSQLAIAPEDSNASKFPDPDQTGHDHPLTNHPSLLAAIQRNQAIPQNSFCTMPEAVVYLDTGDAKPVFRRQFTIAHSLQPIVSQQIESWYQDGKITDAPRSSQWNHPLLIVDKKLPGGTRAPGRVCIDPRELNRCLINPEKYPLPRVNDVFAFLAGFSLFSGLDLEQCFCNYPFTRRIATSSHSPGTAGATCSSAAHLGSFRSQPSSND